MVTYKQGNLLNSGCNIICHQVNCQGVMGSGIALEIRNRFPEAYATFRKTFLNGGNKLGAIDIVYETQDNKGIYICNMYAQAHYLPRGVNHTDYIAFRTCLQKLKDGINQQFKDATIRIGFPFKIGCGLGGGNWNIVSKIIEEEFSDDNYHVEIWKL